MSVNYKVVKKVTFPILKTDIDKTIFVTVDEPMFTGKPIKTKGDENKPQKPATLINVTNLETGEQMQIVANAVLQSVLDDEYPGAGYVGRSFAITKLAKKSGRDYNPFTVDEIEWVL